MKVQVNESWLVIKFVHLFFLGFFLVTQALFGCASDQNLGQAALKNFETRTVDSDIDTVYSAAIEALFDLGYLIKHSDKDAGIIVGEKQDAQKSKKLRSRIWKTLVFGAYGAFGASSVQPIVYNITIFVKYKSQDSTNVRIKTSIDGEPKLDKESIDQVWLWKNLPPEVSPPYRTPNYPD